MKKTALILIAVSIAFIAEASNLLITVLSAVFAVVSIVIVLAFLIHRTYEQHKKKRLKR